MKNFNLIEKLQGCSKRNGTTFRQSNPDGQTTVKRQSRVMSQSGCSAVDVPMTSYGAPDEHPMSTRSVSDGTRWNSRGWKYVAMIFAVLVLSMANVGMAWGTEFTFSGVYNGTGNGSWNTTTSTTPIVTVDKSISNSSVQIYCVSGSSVSYPSLNGNTTYIKFSVPEGYRITNANVKWRSSANSQRIIAIFGQTVSEPSNAVVTATNGGYVISDVIANSGMTNCNDGYNFAISSSHNAKEVMLVRGIAYDNSTYSTANTKYGTFPALLGNSPSGVYTHVEGSGSAAYIGKVVLTVEPTTTTKYTLSYDANGGTGTMPSHEFAAGTTVYAAQNAGFTAPSGKIFKCWNTKANGSGTSYSEWASFSLSANTTLYAQWTTASTSTTYCISLYNLNVSNQMKYFTYSGSSDMQILDLEVPDYQTGKNNFWVGKGGAWKSGDLGNSKASSANERLQDLCLKGNRGQKLGTGSQGVLARFFIYDNSTYDNLYIEFTPKQYSLIWGPDGSSWSPVKLYPSGYENEWTSEVVTLTSDQISSYKYYVGTLKADNGVAFWYKSKTLTVGSMGTYNKRTDTWGGNVNTLSAGAKGFFRMWQNATGYDNWRCHFVPVYTLSYNANGGEGAPASAYTATEGDAAARTLKVSMTEPTRNGYSFEGWATSSANASAGTVAYAPGASITLSADQELWAVWSCIVPDAPTADKISVSDQCQGTGVTFTANTTGIPSYVTWYWQDAADGTSTSNPATSDFTTATTPGTYTKYLRAKNTVCGTWSASGSTPSKSAKVKTAATVSWSAHPTAATYGDGGKTFSVTTNYAGGLEWTLESNTCGAALTGSGTNRTLSYTSVGSVVVKATVTGAGDYCSSAIVSETVTVTAAACTDPVDDLEYTTPTSTGTTLSWDEPGYREPGYKVALTVSGGDPSDSWEDWTSNVYEATGLTPNTTYTFHIKAYGVGKACLSEESTINFKTAATPTYTVTYEYNGATSGATPASATGSSVSLPNPTKTGCTLQGWYTSSGALAGSATATYNPTSNITLYALWRADCAGGGGGGGTLFSQNFNSATEVAYENRTDASLLINKNSSNNIVGTTAASQFTSIAAAKKDKTGIAINTTSGGNSVNASGFFQTYYDNTSGYWSVTKTTDFATTAPTAIKMSMDLYFDTKSSSGSCELVNFAIGDGFSDGLMSTSAQSSSNVHSGWGIAQNSKKICGYNANATILYNTALSESTWYSITWVINNTGEDLTYDDPDGSGTTTLANDKFDIWLKTQAQTATNYTKVVTAAATTTSKALQELYFGHISGKKNEFRIDNIVVADLTPSSGTCYYVTYNGNGATGGFTKDETAYALNADPTVASNSFTKTGYTFTGWNTLANGTGDPYAAGGTISDISADVTLYAQWAADAATYELTWNTNFGSDLVCSGTCTSGDLAYGATIVAPTDPTKSNYTFDGWNTANDGSGSGKASTMPASDVTYYAAWKQTVTLKTGSQGSDGDKTPYIYWNGTALSDDAVHSAAGYTLNGYYTESTGGTKVLNADGTFASANVDGYITSSKWSRTGAAPTLYAQWRAAAGKTCYTWDASETHPQTGTTNYDGLYLTATTKAKKQANSALTDTIYDVSSSGKSLTGHINGAVIDSLIFGASTSSSDNTTFVVSFCSTQTFDTAKIIKVGGYHCTVYNVALNTAAASLTKIKAPAGTKSFVLSRNYMSDKLTSSASLSNSGSRYLYYVRACSASGGTHTISYNAGGGTGTMSSNTGITDDGSQPLTTNSFTAPTNYSFAGWVADVNVTIGGSTVTAGTLIADGATITNITTDIALTAKWSQSVTLNANTSNHGSGDNGSATAYYNAAALSSITHTTAASGYKLSGYYTADTEGTKVLNSDGTFAGTAVTGYITDGKWSRTGTAPTLYAQYESAGALTWNLIVNSDTTNLSTSTKTSAFTEISTSNMTDAALTGLKYSKGKKSSLTGKIEVLSSEDAAKYASVSFQVASGYKFIPSSAKVIIQPVETSNSDVKIILSDGTRTITQTKDNLAKGKKDTVTLTNSDADKYMMGTVTLKIYVYGASSETYRLGTPITIEGEVEEACATMPSFTRLSYGETSYTVDDTPDNLEVIGGTNITTYLWKQNTVNDRSGGSEASGTNNTATYTPSTTSAGTTYYWCEMTNLTCGITIKTSAVGITVNESRTDATVTWSDPGTIYYGGGGYTIKATVDQTTWAGAPEDLSLSAPAGIRIYNVTRGTTSSQDWIQANFDIQTTFDRTTYPTTIPFVVSADAKTGWNAISDQNDVAYEACAEGSGDGSALILVTASMSTAKTGMQNYWEATGVGKLTKNYGSSLTSSEDAQTIEGNSFTHRSASTNSSWMVQPYIAGVTKIRLYFKASATIASGKLGISKVLYDTEYFSSQGDRAVVYSNVETSDDSYAASDLGWVEFELPEMAANSYCYFTTSTSNLYIYGVELFSGSIGTGGTITTGLTWSSGTADGGSVTGKTQSSANFTITATRDAAATVSLGAITYSSSNTSCATINATTGEVTITATGTSELSTTIKATLAASGCYKKKEITYTLTIPGVSCSIASGSIELTSGSASKCSSESITLTLSGFEDGGTVKWYKGDDEVTNGGSYTITTEGATRTLTTTQTGTYSATITKDACTVRTNSITISNKSVSASVTKIVDEWYVKNGRLTPDIELWSLSEGATLKSVAWSPVNGTGLSCVARGGVIYLEGKEPNENNSSDVVYTLTATITDACGGEHEETTKTIKITHQKNTDKHVLAFVVNGTEKGGFTEGLTAAQTTDVPLYKTIATNFDVQATNCYASDDEKKVKQYYSQYDILCITDYPNSNKTGANSKKYVDVLGKLIDVRPILTMEAFVSDKANWKAKGISGSPKSPTTRQYSMLLQCKDHEIFSGTDLVKVGEGDETMYRVTMVAKDSDDYKTLDATYGEGAHAEKSGYNYGGKPALQGFTFSSEMLEDGLLPLGLIDDGAGNDLQVGIERQAEMTARLMVIGINSYAMERLTKDGQKVIINALNYLMKKNEEEIADCSITFIGGDETKPNDWETASNWKGGQKPDKTTREIRILAEVIITDGQNIRAQAPIKIASRGTYNDGADNATGKITIEAGGALRADGEIQAVTAPAYSKARPTSVGDIHIKATSEKGNGTLIFKNDEGTSQAIVEMYSKASFDGVNVSWQYIAVPFATTETAYENYYGSWLYRWAEDCSGWEVIPNRGDVGPWIGYCITQVGTKTYTMTGKLVETTTQEFSVPAGKEMVIGNSWTAPIQVKQFTDDDFSGLDANVYLFNTGYDPNGEGGSAGGDRYAAGTYVTIPIHAASYTGDSLISSLQAFIVNNKDGGSAQTLTLDYDRHVRPTRATDKVNAGQMHAPVRRAVVADGEPEVLKLFVSGSRYDDRLVVLAREDFSAGFDNGWDGQNINEQGDAPMMYALREDGTRDAVSAVPEFEGTIVGFQAGEDDVYTMSFVYAEEAEPLYILDTDNETYTRVLTDNTYTFTTNDKAAHSRFVLTRTDGQMTPTGIDDVQGDKVHEAKAKKFIMDDKMYILFNGRVFDATGKAVK